jgi:Transposase domain (DUF772)
MLRLYIWGYLNQVRSSRHLEKACVRDLEALWLMRRLAPDYRTIAAFRHDNPEAIVRTGAAFVQFCREQGLVGGRMVALDEIVGDLALSVFDVARQALGAGDILRAGDGPDLGSSSTRKAA